ncbi:beta-mannosidase [Carboxylicivirga marina]|uniref:beta-mannosidase n=1 Tax=Carboxylicivirga marina TaxID=2800988 RepID=UPI0025991C49|nr:glycoside hydrolase family 2 protein [uncultured Carboxylicivirga sp.]
MKQFIFLVISCLMIFNSCSNTLEKRVPQKIILSDSDWFFAEKDSLNFLPANVPGSVHMDLLQNQFIEEPYYRNNEKELQWIGERDWVYKTSFNVTQELLKHDAVELCFEGLDTYAEVYLNEKHILSADNYFRQWLVNAKEYLVPGENTLQILFQSSVQANKDKRRADSVPLFDDYAYSRKPAFHFGWDWGPVFITAGVWRPVYLKAWSDAMITDAHIIQKSVNKNLAELNASISVEASEPLEAILIVEVEEAGIKEQLDVSLTTGLNKLACEFKIENPELWWSHGLGEANLYEVKTSLVSKSDLLDSKETKVGIRDIKLVQNPDELGSSFHFELNGVPVFAKGANYIPQESFQSKVDSADYRRVIQHAIDANMNMIRVWGGGFYEEDYFYDLCDQHGILVWQDFMFACSMYPGETEYLENVKQEAIDNVKRLRNHASLALWCGNNENYIGWRDWRWPGKFPKEDSAKVWNDYLALFEELLPEVIEEYDKGKDYWPSSPKYGWGYPVNSDGDSHLWAVWHAQDPFEVFLEKENIPRFMSEYGFQSLPEMKTIEAFTLPEDRSIDSDVMKNHQKHRIGYPVIDTYLKRDYQWPKDFESYIYISQVLQAKGIKMGIEAHRRAMPFCMGTLYWQLNDCWPVASWSSVDYYNRWKALHYKVRDAYAPVLVSPLEEQENINIYLVSDEQQEQQGQLLTTIFDFQGNVVWESNQDVTVPANTSQKVASFKTNDMLKGHQRNELVCMTKVIVDDQIIANNTLYLESPKDLNLKKAKLSYQIEKLGEDALQITLTTAYLAKDICLSFPELEGFFTDNYFDLIPGETKQIQFRSQALRNTNTPTTINIKSLVDSY